MGSGLCTFIVVTCLVVFGAFVLMLALLRAAWRQREREALTSHDLRALEESAVMLIEQLRTEADRKIEEMEQVCSRLSRLLEEADDRVSKLMEQPQPVAVCTHEAQSPAGPKIKELDSSRQRVLELASTGIDCAEIARREDLGCAEVKLILRLARMEHN